MQPLVGIKRPRFAWGGYGALGLTRASWENRGESRGASRRVAPPPPRSLHAGAFLPSCYSSLSAVEKIRVIYDSPDQNLVLAFN